MKMEWFFNVFFPKAISLSLDHGPRGRDGIKLFNSCQKLWQMAQVIDAIQDAGCLRRDIVECMHDEKSLRDTCTLPDIF